MRSINTVLRPVLDELRDSPAAKELNPSDLENLCRVELGLFLQEEIVGAAPAVEAWALFSGYPFAKAWGVVTTASDERKLRTSRYSLWVLRRREYWLDLLETYQGFDSEIRAYDVFGPEIPVSRRRPWFARDRHTYYANLLSVAPGFEGNPQPMAGPGTYGFAQGREQTFVTFPENLGSISPSSHELNTPRRGTGPVTIPWAGLMRTASAMDSVRHENWEERLKNIRLYTPTANGLERNIEGLTFSGILHLLGIVGVGKSTLRDILTVYLVNECHLRVTIMVGDVADLLNLVAFYNLHTKGAAAPVVGVSSRELHTQRLHRRQAARLSPNLLAHDHPGFSHLSTSCALNALRWEQQGVDEPLATNDAPCTRLRLKGHRHTCPFWTQCPRHRGEEQLVAADIWVATPQSLVHSAVPWPQNAERIRYLEIACRRSDLVIVDEADRVQMQLDQLFAPAVTLEGGSTGESFLFKVNQRKLSALAAGKQEQLSNKDVETWSEAVNTVTAATNRIYPMLLNDPDLRAWVRGRYFNSWTLQLRLIEERYPPPPEGDSADPDAKARRTLTMILDEFRDSPFGDIKRLKGEPGGLVKLLSELLHTSRQGSTRTQLTVRMKRLFNLDPVLQQKWKEFRADGGEDTRRRGKSKVPESPDAWIRKLARRFEFTLLLSALEPKLALMNTMWPRVEAILNLGFNQMYRTPQDYAPIVPESPMGNVLGFQFLTDGPDRGGVRSGELRYFRCNGIGRELLRAMPGLPTVDGLPETNVMLLSGSSWAAESTRFHVQVPVGGILKPPPEVTKAITTSRFRLEFLPGREGALTASGASESQRPEVLKQMAIALGTADRGEESRLQRELEELPEARRHILLLVGSYVEATLIADTLHAVPGWKGRVIRLASDDDELDANGGGAEADEHHARVLRRGDVDNLANVPGEILVAPLLAVERGHNILNADRAAAIGSVYFLARPNPRPDDLGIAVHAINDWTIRAIEDGAFTEWVREKTTLDAGARAVRGKARSHWYRLLARSLAWSRLGDDRTTVTWDMLVLIWQVIGRLARGGVPARVIFVDAAFAPHTAAGSALRDTPQTSLLYSMHDVLSPYCDPGRGDATIPPLDRDIVQALFGPLWSGLRNCLFPSDEGAS